MSTEQTIEQQLTHALAESSKASEAYKLALEKLSPLEQASHTAAEKVNELIAAFQREKGFTGTVSGTRKKRAGSGKPYNISPESKISRAGKSAYTRGIKGGMTEAQAKKAQKEAEASLKAKLDHGDTGAA